MWPDWLAQLEADRQARREHRKHLVLGSTQIGCGLLGLLMYTLDALTVFLVVGVIFLLTGVGYLAPVIKKHPAS
jgi:uncharacterized membrane protein HdeD (DUF308 family)